MIELTEAQKEELSKLGFNKDPNTIPPVLQVRAYYGSWSINNNTYADIHIPILDEVNKDLKIREIIYKLILRYKNKVILNSPLDHWIEVHWSKPNIGDIQIYFKGDFFSQEEISDHILEFLYQTYNNLVEEIENSNQYLSSVATPALNRLKIASILISAGSVTYIKRENSYDPLS